MGEGGDDLLVLQNQGQIEAGDTYDGGVGADTLLIAQGVTIPARAALISIEVTLTGAGGAL